MWAPVDSGVKCGGSPASAQASLLIVGHGSGFAGHCAVECSVVDPDLRKLAEPIPRALTERLASVGQLIDGGRLGEARIELESSQGEPPELVELIRLKLRVAAREIEAGTALTRVVALLEKYPNHPAAMSVYRELSLLQYKSGQSCPSFSHPPPSRDR
jgi:hypothetical protein